jgi:hypothetical protein
MVLTHIRILPYQSGKVGIVKLDPLREYYLEWRNFSQTEKDDVQGLIDNFWHQIQGLLLKTAISSAEVTQAYEKLLLPQGTHLPLVKRQYHKLLHKVHPDKGGDKAQTQELEHSYRILKSVFR